MAFVIKQGLSKARMATANKVATSMLVMLVVTDLQTIAALTPQLALALEAKKTTISYSLVIYAVTAAAIALVLRNETNGVGRPKVLPLAAGFYGAACLLTAMAPNITFFLTARLLSGLAGGLISALAITALANGASYERRGLNMSLVSISYYLAPLVGVPINALLASYGSWRGVFLLLGVSIGIVGLLLWQISVSELAGITVASLTEKGEPHVITHAQVTGLGNYSATAVLGIINAFFVSGGLIGFTTYLAIWLFDTWRADLKEIGFIYALINAGALLGGILGGLLADKYGKRTVILRSNLAMAVSLLLLPALTQPTVILSFTAVITFLAAMRVAPLQALLTELVIPAQRASYIATRNVASQLGIGAAVLCCGKIYPANGFAGVSVICAVLTVGAWLTISAVIEPQRINELSG